MKISIIKNLDSGNPTVTRLYDHYGQAGVQPSGAYRQTTVGYDSTSTYPVTTTNPLGSPTGTTTTTYDPATGLPLTVTDPNASTTTTIYNGLGRVESITYPGYSTSTPNVKYTCPSLPVSSPFAVKLEAWDEPAGVYRPAWAIYDGLGRTLQVQGPSQDGTGLVLTDTKYDALGQVKQSSLTRLLANTAGGAYQTPPWTAGTYSTNTYDALSRLTSTSFPNGSTSSTTYDGLRTTVKDQNSRQKIQELDAFGRLVKVEEYTGTSTYTLYATTTYAYDRRDLLTGLTDAAGNVTSLAYDGWGRKTQMVDPDMGDWRYQYEPLGNLAVQIDAKRQATNLYYDALGRLIGKTYTAGPVDPATYTRPADPTYTGYTLKYYFDKLADGSSVANGLGHRVQMNDASGQTTWTYNGLGRVDTETRTITGAPQAYTTIYHYDAFGRPKDQTYPGTGEVLNFYYTAMGLLSKLSNGTTDYVSGVNYNASGQITDEALGNGVSQQFCYQAATLRLTDVRVYKKADNGGSLVSCGTTPSAAKLNLNYQYNAGGDVTQMVDATRNETLTYTYDDLDRLTSVGNAYSQSFAYSGNDGKIGNLSSKAGVSLSYAAQSSSCPDGALTKAHAVTSAGSDSYCYDADGNMVKRTEGGVTYTQNFDADAAP